VSLLPIFCVSCARFSLVSHVLASARGVARCHCGCDARVVTNDPCSRGEQWLFEAVASTIEAAEITPLGARRLLDELEASSGEAAEAQLARLSAIVPELAILEIVASVSDGAADKAIGTLRSLLDVLGKRRTPSGFIVTGNVGRDSTRRSG
jgi:hypothetical protein